MGSILLFLKPTPKKFILPVILILLPWFGVLASVVLISLNFPSSFPAQIGLWSLFGLLELPLQILNNLFNLNLPRGCGGGGWLGFCMFSSSVQGVILISLFYGLLGYLVSSILIGVKNKLLAVGSIILILVGLSLVLVFAAKQSETVNSEATKGILQIPPCTQDSDCPEGLVCVGKGPTQPSKEIPGVCLPSKASQATY